MSAVSATMHGIRSPSPCALYNVSIFTARNIFVPPTRTRTRCNFNYPRFSIARAIDRTIYGYIDIREQKGKVRKDLFKSEVAIE